MAKPTPAQKACPHVPGFQNEVPGAGYSCPVCGLVNTGTPDGSTS